MSLTIELVGADEAHEVLEKALKLRDPELWEARRKNRAKARRKARKTGEQLQRPVWQPLPMLVRGDYEPLRKLGLADLNRPFSKARMELYADEMDGGRWGFNPDPIVISDQGYVLNGQHRLVAATTVIWEEGVEVPEFLVVWGVDKRTALLMDEASRNGNDRRTIALGYARAA
jgi:hypothetical protein